MLFALCNVQCIVLDLVLFLFYSLAVTITPLIISSGGFRKLFIAKKSKQLGVCGLLRAVSTRLEASVGSILLGIEFAASVRATRLILVIRF